MLPVWVCYQFVCDLLSLFASLWFACLCVCVGGRIEYVLVCLWVYICACGCVLVSLCGVMLCVVLCYVFCFVRFVCMFDMLFQWLFYVSWFVCFV